MVILLQMPQLFRFGVLYAKDGQTTEAEMYDNGKVYKYYSACILLILLAGAGSPAFNKFLDFIGQRISLKVFLLLPRFSFTHQTTTFFFSFFLTQGLEAP